MANGYGLNLLDIIELGRCQLDKIFGNLEWNFLISYSIMAIVASASTS